MRQDTYYYNLPPAIIASWGTRRGGGRRERLGERERYRWRRREKDRGEYTEWRNREKDTKGEIAGRTERRSKRKRGAEETDGKQGTEGEN